jgi:serine/threonine-protein kinase RsbW
MALYDENPDDDEVLTSVPADGAVVELTVPAQTSYLGVVRTATAGLAARLSFTLDEIEDLRIAVDEACVMLLSLPRPAQTDEATLTCRFRVLADALAVTVSGRVGPRAVMPADQSFAWQVLTAHAADVRGRVDHGVAVVELLKSRRRR